MLKKLRLINYKGYKDTTISFSPTLTGIVGISDSGKTALLRAIRLVKDNKPAGFSYKSHFAKPEDKTKVIIDVDDSTIEFMKSSKDKHYKINNGKPFRKMKHSNVPEEVSALLNIKDINIQYEFDDPFLVRGSKPEIARAISRAVKTDIIEKARTKIRKDGNDLKGKLKYINEDIEDIEARLESLKKLDKVKSIIEEYMQLKELLEEKEERYEDIQTLFSKIKKKKKKIKRTKKLISNIKPLLEELSKINDKAKRLRSKKELLSQIKLEESWIKKTKVLHNLKISSYIKALIEFGECPTCFGDLDKKTVRRIKDELKARV